MAATKLITMHQNKGLSVLDSIANRLDYAENDDKTENGQYVTSYECNPKTVAEEFALSKKEYFRITGRKIQGDILAYQIRQSFKPGEVIPEQANAIGYETAMRFTKGNHAFVVATHTDREHIHNHIIYNSTSLDCTHKFKDFFLVGIALQKLSDEICLEQGLSVIKPRSYSERSKRTEFPWRKTKRATVCEDIDKALSQNLSGFADLLKALHEMGYEIKHGANPSIRGKDQKRFVRFRSLGPGYTVEDLERTIAGEFQTDGRTSKWKEKEAQRQCVSSDYRKRDFDLLVNIEEKLRQGKGPGYERWAKIFNLKQMSQALLFLQENDVRDYETLAEKADSSSRLFNELSQQIKVKEARLSQIAEMRKHIYGFAKTKEVYEGYKKSGYSKKYFEKHREEITIHKAAKEAFSKYPKGKIPKMKELNAEYSKVLYEKRRLYQEYQNAKKEMKDYVIAKKNIDALLGDDLKNSPQREEQAPTK